MSTSPKVLSHTLYSERHILKETILSKLKVVSFLELLKVFQSTGNRYRQNHHL